MDYLQSLRKTISERGSSNIVFIDESGFQKSTQRDHAWGVQGQKVYDERAGNNRGGRTNLIAGKRKKQLLAPILFTGSTDATWFNSWLKEHLFKELKPNSTLIMDNASFHKKAEIKALADSSGHHVLFLPPYSPDFNPIEKVFAHLKKRRANAPPGTSLDEIIKLYGNSLE